MKHGTEVAYKNKGCRCKLCKKGRRERRLAYWLKIPKLLIKPENYTKPIEEKINIHGYAYFYDIEHPICNSSGKVLVHRHEASKMIGRWVLPEEDVHHIDHNKLNNSWSNLEVITKSEHTIKHNLENGYTLRTDKLCKICGKLFRQTHKDHAICSLECSGVNNRKTTHPTKEELEKLVWEMPTAKLATIFKVSDKAIEKWCKKYNITKPPRGYWAKLKAKDDQTTWQNS